MLHGLSWYILEQHYSCNAVPSCRNYPNESGICRSADTAGPTCPQRSWLRSGPNEWRLGTSHICHKTHWIHVLQKVLLFCITNFLFSVANSRTFLYNYFHPFQCIHHKTCNIYHSQVSWPLGGGSRRQPALMSSSRTRLRRTGQSSHRSAGACLSDIVWSADLRKFLHEVQRAHFSFYMKLSCNWTTVVSVWQTRWRNVVSLAALNT